MTEGLMLQPHTPVTAPHTDDREIDVTVPHTDDRGIDVTAPHP